MANIHLNKPTDFVNQSYRRSDHKSFQEKKHSLIIDAQSAVNKEIKTESGTLRFENGVAVLPDDTRAKDVYDELAQDTHPDHYALVEDKQTVNVSQTHRYHFGWNRIYEQAHERLFGNSKDDTENYREEIHDRQDEPRRDSKPQRGAR